MSKRVSLTVASGRGTRRLGARRCLALAVSAATTVLALLGPVSRPVLAANALNDYPVSLWQNVNIGQFNDPWSFPVRQCTSFAAWRQNRDGNAMTDGMRGGWFGNAGNWDYNATHISPPLTVTTTPTLGSVGQWENNESPGPAGPNGHVSYTQSTSPVAVEDYNWGSPAGTYHLHQITPPRYIIFAPASQYPGGAVKENASVIPTGGAGNNFSLTGSISLARGTYRWTTALFDSYGNLVAQLQRSFGLALDTYTWTDSLTFYAPSNLYTLGSSLCGSLGNCTGPWTNVITLTLGATYIWVGTLLWTGSF